MVTVLVLEVVHRYKKVFVYQYSTYKEAIALCKQLTWLATRHCKKNQQTNESFA